MRIPHFLSVQQHATPYSMTLNSLENTDHPTKTYGTPASQKELRLPPNHHITQETLPPQT